MAEPPTSTKKEWGAGNLAKVLATSAYSAELLCESVRLHARERVLDVATGSGNTAMAAARRRAQVVGVDFLPSLLQRARERAAAEQLEIDYREGDAEKLPFGDGEFDCVLSTYGVMFAPHQAVAARELARVCRRGGRIGIASWTPDGYIGEYFRVIGGSVAEDPEGHPPVRWGTDACLRELFPEPLVLRTAKRTTIIRGDSPALYLEGSRKFFGPVVTAFAARDPVGQTQLQADLERLVTQWNRSGDDTVFIEAEYLEAVIRKP